MQCKKLKTFLNFQMGAWSRGPRTGRSSPLTASRCCRTPGSASGASWAARASASPSPGSGGQTQVSKKRKKIRFNKLSPKFFHFFLLAFKIIFKCNLQVNVITNWMLHISSNKWEDELYLFFQVSGCVPSTPRHLSSPQLTLSTSRVRPAMILSTCTFFF